jgi:galactofuranose transport system ATP-binding protein
MAGISKLELVTTMLGKELAGVHRGVAADRKPSADTPALLEARDIVSPPRVRRASLQLHAGQTVGLAGLLGAGRTELMRALYGADTPAAGEVRLDGQVVRLQSPADALARGIAYLSEDRKAEGIFPNLSVRENLSIALLPRLARAGLVDRAAQARVVDEFIARLGIKTADPGQPVSQLSGGNQQKVLLARWLALKPRVMLLDEPTRGVDVGAKADIAALVHQLAAEGMGIVLTTSELEELVAMSDVAVVLRDGTSVAEIDADALTEEAVMAAMADAAPAGGGAARG